MAQNRPARPAPHSPGLALGDGVTQKEIAPYRGRIIKRGLKVFFLRFATKGYG